jgi:hypothetical protein
MMLKESMEAFEEFQVQIEEKRALYQPLAVLAVRPPDVPLLAQRVQ